MHTVRLILALYVALVMKLLAVIHFLKNFVGLDRNMTEFRFVLWRTDTELLCAHCENEIGDKLLITGGQ